MSGEVPTVAHPDSPIQNPYLGRNSLYLFDVMIPGAMKFNTTVADWTHGRSLTPIQRAACQIIPNGFSIALSIRELLRSGYLFSAEILGRPLMKRLAVISYLMATGDDALALWNQGWPHKTRPSLKEMLSTIVEYDQFPTETGDIRAHSKRIIDHFNSVIHADPSGLDSNIGLSASGVLGYLSGANINDPDRCDLICAHAITYMSLLLKRAEQIFPNLNGSAETRN